MTMTQYFNQLQNYSRGKIKTKLKASLHYIILIDQLIHYSLAEFCTSLHGASGQSTASNITKITSHKS